jgi:hypothetical protein
VSRIVRNSVKPGSCGFLMLRILADDGCMLRSELEAKLKLLINVKPGNGPTMISTAISNFALSDMIAWTNKSDGRYLAITPYGIEVLEAAERKMNGPDHDCNGTGSIRAVDSQMDHRVG